MNSNVHSETLLILPDHVRDANSNVSYFPEGL